MNPSSEATILAEPAHLPDWIQPLLAGLVSSDASEMLQFSLPGEEPVRQSAVLILFAAGDSGPDVLIIERAAQMRAHAGQPAFPGGAFEPTDAGPVDAALREAQEETNLDPSGVTIVALLPELWIPPSGFVVNPVVGWWHAPGPVGVGDATEVAAVHRIPVAELVDPANRVKVTHPKGYVGPGFRVNGMLIWGFTGIMLDRLFSLADWNIPWENSATTIHLDAI